MKICSICGTKNCLKSNFCIHCGVIINPDMHCPSCDGIIDPSDVFCQHCSKQISPIIIEDFSLLFNSFNEDLLNNYEFSSQKYKKLLNSTCSPHTKTIVEGSIRNMIEDICGLFAVCSPKHNIDDNGYSFTNRIYYDDRLTAAEQIGVLIHELAHVLLFEFILALVCDIFQSKRTSTLESFVHIFVSKSSVMPTINEYYASTVESRFIHLKYRNYNSFLKRKKKLPQPDLIKRIISIANCLSNDVIERLEKFITEDLRNEIKRRYAMDDIKPSDCPVNNDMTRRYSIDQTCNELMRTLKVFYNEASKGKYARNLVNIKNNIEKG